jgi:two-component system NarL family response regulator
MTTRVILADDHQVFLEGLTRLLVENGAEVAACTRDRDELLELIRRHRPQVAVVDISMPGLSIPQLLAALGAEGAETAVLVLTGSAAYTAAEDFLAAGAKGFLLKDHAFDTILAAIAALAQGRCYVSPEIAGELLAARRRGAAEVVLTSRQLEILRLVAAGDTNKRIAGKLGLHYKTVDAHRQRIREKLGARSTAEMIRRAQERGLL